MRQSNKNIIEDIDINVVISVKAFSERCHNKNLKLFYRDKSLLEIKILQMSNVISKDKIYVFSDSEQAAKIAAQHGVHFAPYAPTDSWSESFYSIVKQVRSKYVLRACVTTPFIGSDIVRDMILSFMQNKNDYDSIVAVEKIQSHLLSAAGAPINYLTGKEHKGSQDLEPIYSVKAGVFMLATETAKHYQYHFGKKPMLYEVPQQNAIDINSVDDWKMAQLLLSSDEIKEYIGWELE